MEKKTTLRVPEAYVSLLEDIRLLFGFFGIYVLSDLVSYKRGLEIERARLGNNFLEC